MTSPVGVPIIPRETENLLKKIALRAHALAIADIGKGEIDANNTSPYIRTLLGGRKVGGPWCAAFVYAKHLQAATEIGLELPIERTHSARRLAERIAAVGRWLEPSETPQLGDLVLWARPPVPWYGHIGIVHTSQWPRFTAVEGNRGGFPAYVDVFPHRFGERRLLGFARLWR